MAIIQKKMAPSGAFHPPPNFGSPLSSFHREPTAKMASFGAFHLPPNLPTSTAIHKHSVHVPLSFCLCDPGWYPIRLLTMTWAIYSHSMDVPLCRFLVFWVSGSCGAVHPLFKDVSPTPCRCILCARGFEGRAQYPAMSACHSSLFQCGGCWSQCRQLPPSLSLHYRCLHAAKKRAANTGSQMDEYITWI